MAARVFPILAGVGGAFALGFTARECARVGQTALERCVPCAFAAGAVATGAAIAYCNTEAYFDGVEAANRSREERGAAGAAEIKRREEERFQAATMAIMRDAERRKQDAEKIDRYVDPRVRD